MVLGSSPTYVVVLPLEIAIIEDHLCFQHRFALAMSHEMLVSAHSWEAYQQNRRETMNVFHLLSFCLETSVYSWGPLQCRLGRGVLHSARPLAQPGLQGFHITSRRSTFPSHIQTHATMTTSDPAWHDLILLALRNSAAEPAEGTLLWNVLLGCAILYRTPFASIPVLFLRQSGQVPSSKASPLQQTASWAFVSDL